MKKKALTLRGVRAKLTQVEKLKNEIATRRDEIRLRVDEAADLLDSLDLGDQDLEHGLSILRGGIDAISELL